jgi:hypothetical protein
MPAGTTETFASDGHGGENVTFHMPAGPFTYNEVVDFTHTTNIAGLKAHFTTT